MSEDVGQERTQQATPRRKEQAREKGQVSHSRELNTMFMLLSAGATAYFLGPAMIKELAELLQQHFALEREVIFDPSIMPGVFAAACIKMLMILAPFFLIMIVAAIAGPLAMGGVTFSAEALNFKYDRIDPVKGMQRVFSLKGFIELLKAVAKFFIIAAIAILFLYHQSSNYFSLSGEPIEQGMAHAGNLLIYGFFTIAATLIVIAVIDVPFQIWDFNKQIKMTFQEVKDESKETEGNPEVRSRIKRMQREMAQRRMMSEVPKADVIVTNPEHYSVALRYDQKKMRAPIVVAKGMDLIAFHIRTIAREHQIPILEAPMLARALHHTTDLNREIPAGLYLAVAKVLAYVFQLKREPYWQRKRDLKMDDLPIPDDMRFDS